MSSGSRMREGLPGGLLYCPFGSYGSLLEQCSNYKEEEVWTAPGNALDFFFMSLGATYERACGYPGVTAQALAWDLVLQFKNGRTN